MRTAMSIALAITLLLWSSATVVVDFFFARPYRDVAAQLEKGRSIAPDRAYFERVARSLGGDWLLALCSRDILRSAVTIKLGDLDASYRQKDPVNIDPALGDARTTLTRALGCIPNDGNFWLRLAIVNFAAKSPAAVVEEQLERSLVSAPSEAWIVMPRLAFAAQIREATTPGIEQVMQADARSLVNYARDSELADFYVNTNERARVALDEQIHAVNEERGAALMQAIAASAKSKAPRK